MIPVVEVSGNPWEIGHSIGSQLSSNLKENVERFKKRVKENLDEDRFEVKIGPIIAITEKVAPRTFEEIKGMAEGACVDFKYLFGLNSSQELNYQGCSSLAVNGYVTADNSVILGHNEDNSPFYSDSCYILNCSPDDDPAFLAFTYAGLVLHQGFNDHGIGSVGNALYSNDLKLGVPKLIAYREVMRSTYLEEAIRKCVRPDRGNGNNHLLANLMGEIIDLEVSGTKDSMLHLYDGFIAHTNHFIDEKMRTLDSWADLLNSRLRLNRLNNLLSHEVEITVDSVKKILSDHSNYPKSVCKHVKKGVNEQVSTIGSVIMDLTNKTLYATSGNPCKNKYRQIKLT